MTGVPLKLHNRKPSGHHEEESDSEGTWAVSYGDMVTLLLTFFILFFSMEQKSTKAQQIHSSLIDELSNRQAAPEKQAGVPDEKESAALKVTAFSEFPGENPQIRKITFPKEFNPAAYESGEKILVEFPGVSFFDSSEVVLTAEGKKSLANFAKIFTRYAGNFYVGIRAFTDDRKVRKGIHRYNDNLELSALRSIAAMRELQKNGIPLDRIRTGGFGELIVTARDLSRLPASQRDPRYQKALARKVVLVIEPGGEK